MDETGKSVSNDERKPAAVASASGMVKGNNTKPTTTFSLMERSPSNQQQQARSLTTNLADLTSFQRMNLALLDPPRWGWTVAGGIADVLTPHERARRTKSRQTFLKRRKRDRAGNLLGGVDGGDLERATRGRRASAASRNSGSQLYSSTVAAIPSSLMESDLGATLVASAESINSAPTPNTSSSQAEALKFAELGNEHAATGGESSLKKNQLGHGSNGVNGSSAASSSAIPIQNLNSQISSNDPKVSGSAYLNGTISRGNKSKPPPSSRIQRPPLSEPVKFGALWDSAAPAGAGGGAGQPVSASTSLSNNTSLQSDSSHQAATQPDSTRKVLDIYSYHRGREGFEYRDDETGAWQCDVNTATDSLGTSWDGPKATSVSLVIEFALSSSHSFRENINIDLADPETATPLQIATLVSNEYGLSFAQTVDLADSIQRQIKAIFGKRGDSSWYTPPVPTPDPQTGGRRSSNHHNTGNLALYGQVLGWDQHGRGGKPCLPTSSTKSERGRNSLSLAPPIPMRIARPPQPKKKAKAPSTNSRSKKEKVKEKKEREKPSASELEAHRNEVQDRLLHRSMDIAQAFGGEDLAVESDAVKCHICKATSVKGFSFRCGSEDHSFCANHMQDFPRCVRATDDAGTTRRTVACPICSLVCSCKSCQAKLDALASDLRRECVDRKCSPKAATFEHLWERYCSLDSATQNHRSSETKKSSGARKSGETKKSSDTKKSGETKKTVKRSSTKIRLIVPKIPVTEFPREVSEGMDLDPGTPADYLAVFTEKGAELPPTPQPKTETLPPASDLMSPDTKVIEDGSVDYCMICRNHGHLLCCDFCPRAYHADCLGDKKSNHEDSTPWECPYCVEDTAGRPEDEVNYAEKLPLMENRYGDLAQENDNMTIVLAAICVTLVRLMEFDFGTTFSKPVEGVADYCKVIKKPIDLGSILSNLKDGSYRSAEGQTAECVVIQVLKDIELVWQNCFSFNYEGSAVYRMAQVQRRRAHAIKMRSFDKFLTERIRQSLLEYEMSWGRGAAGEPLKPSATAAAKAQFGRRSAPSPSPYKSRHKITVPARKHKGRVIAILDPESCKIVKMYSTTNAGAAAILFLLGLKHPCEFEFVTSDTSARVRRLVRDSLVDPTLLIFGYRWLYLDELREGKVKFKEKSQEQSKPPLADEKLAKSVNGDSEPKPAVEPTIQDSIKTVPEASSGASVSDNRGLQNEVSQVHCPPPQQLLDNFEREHGDSAIPIGFSNDLLALALNGTHFNDAAEGDEMTGSLKNGSILFSRPESPNRPTFEDESIV